MILEYSFRKSGYEVFKARYGTEVLEFLKNTAPGVIPLDIMMPNLNGFSTLEIIKKDEKLNNNKTIFLMQKPTRKTSKKDWKLAQMLTQQSRIPLKN